MNDNNLSYIEVSAKRKKRNQFISLLIILAIILLGVIVWGWIELDKNRKSERIKMALNSQVEPSPKSIDSLPATNPDSNSSSVLARDTVVISEPKPIETPPVEPELPPVSKPVAEPVAKPASPTVPPKIHKTKPHTAVHHEKPATPKAAPTPEMAKTPTPVVPAPAAVQPPPSKPIPAATPVPVAPPVTPVVPAPVSAPVAKTPAAVPMPPSATKAYPPEDLPAPTKDEPTEEARLAMATTPVGKALPATTSGTAEVEGFPGASESFKSGVAAYKSQDYVNAIRSFSAISKPASKKRGSEGREEYVQANFLKGMSMLKVGHLSEAVSAFQNVLEFEKYYPLANMNLGICYVELKQYAKAHQAFESVVRDQSFLEPAVFDDVMQRTKYFWALAWTRLYKNATNVDKQNYFHNQAIIKWKDYDVWFSKNDKYKTENLKAENYLKSLGN